MKNIIKNIAVVATGLLLGMSAMAQTSGMSAARYIPLLTGFDVLVTTNTTPGFGVTNTLYTSANGQIVYSLTNNTFNGTLNTNLTVPDAFKVVTLLPDVNADINGNASVFISIGNTNLIPIAVTNNYGQYFVTNWPLALSQVPNWMYPATTNLYPTFTAQSTNAITVTLYAGIPEIRGGIGPNQGTGYPLFETTGSFSFTVIPTGTTPFSIFTNLPTSFLQHAHKVYAAITVGAGVTTNLLINTLGIVQPQP